MEKITAESAEAQSADIVNENIEQLKKLFPDAFTEDGINFESLRQLLGDEGVLGEGEEKYGLNWHGKKQARQIALTPSTGTLLPCPEESVDWDTTQNLFIEGDNLEVLKLLQKSYAGKVKMIYIDPPYNTGKEFIYPDKYQDNLDTYLKYTGQVDSEGMKFSSNVESTGRKHTSWLNMMYPRIKLAKNLLKNDGAIFVSIDDNELRSLLPLMNEIFGEENFVGSVCWKNKYGAGAKTKGFIEVHEYVLCFSKTPLANIESILSEEQIKVYDKKKDDKYETRGGYVTQPIMTNSLDDRSNLQYDIEHEGDVISPRKQWVWAKDRLLKAIENNEVVFKKKDDGEYSVRAKVYLRNEAGILRKGKPLSMLNGPFNQEGTKEVAGLIGGNIFSFPKPSSLIRHFFGFTINDEDDDGGIFLDFFSGSCSSAQAVFDLNHEDNGDRRHIMIQLPELCDVKSGAYKAGYKTISEIGKERIRQAGNKIKEENPDYQGDLGFKVFKLASSNIKAWNPDRTDLEQTLLDHQDHLIEGRTEQDVLYELLLKRGVDLTAPIEEKAFKGKTVYSIGYGALFACLDESIESDDVAEIVQGIIDWYKELAPSSETHIFFRDSAFADDEVKTNIVLTLEQNGLSHVRSL